MIKLDVRKICTNIQTYLLTYLQGRARIPMRELFAVADVLVVVTY